MKIKIKVKYLVMTILAVMILVTVLFYVDYTRNEETAQGQMDENGTLMMNKQALFRKINQASGDEKWKLIRNSIDAQFEPILRSFDVYVGGGGSESRSVNEDSLHLSWNDKVPYLEQYLSSGPVDLYFMNAAQQLGWYYNSQDEWTKSMKLLDEAKVKSNGTTFTEVANILLLQQAQLAFEHQDYTQSSGISEALNKRLGTFQSDLNMKFTWLRIQQWIQSGQRELALQAVLHELEVNQQSGTVNSKDTKPMRDSKPMMNEFTSLRKLLQNPSHAEDKPLLATVSGTIRKQDGTPLALAGVYLRHQNDVSHSIIDTEPYQVLTDNKGHYSIQGVVPDSYQLFLGLDYDEIDGYSYATSANDWIEIKSGQQLTKDIVLQPLLELRSPVNMETIRQKSISFEWESVAGAAYYDLAIQVKLENGTISPKVKGHIELNRTEVQVEDLYNVYTGISSYSDGKSAYTIDPKSLLGYSNTENQYLWYIEAYDAKGHLLTRSNGYRLSANKIGNLPLFYLKERVMTAADHLLLAGKFDQAMAQYKMDYEQNQLDVHSLRMMVILIDAKNTNFSGTKSSVDAELRKELEAEQLAYVRQLLQINPSSPYISRLLDDYYDHSNWAKYNATFETYVRLHPDDDMSYTGSRHAVALMKQGRLAESEAWFARMLRSDETHRFIGPYLALELFKGSEYEAVQQLAKQYPERELGSNSQQWVDLLKQMTKEDAGEDRYNQELRQKLGWFIEGKKEQLDQWQPPSGRSGMKRFIEALLAVK